MLRTAGIAALLVAPVAADTVFLYNGTAIDGIVRARYEDSLELQIGKLGRIFIPLKMIESVEKNERDGTQQSSSLSLERKREKVGPAKETEEKDAQVVEVKDQKPVAQSPKVLRYLRKEDVTDPELRQKIERNMHELLRQRARNRVRAERALVALGEPVVPFVIEAGGNANHLVRLAVLRILKQVGNEAAIPVALQRLSDENEFVRQAAVEVLQSLTGKNFGYEAAGRATKREKAVAAWRAWYETSKEKQILDALRKEPSQGSPEPSGAKEPPRAVKSIPKGQLR